MTDFDMLRTYGALKLRIKCKNYWEDMEWSDKQIASIYTDLFLRQVFENPIPTLNELSPPRYEQGARKAT